MSGNNICRYFVFTSTILRKSGELLRLRTKKVDNLQKQLYITGVCFIFTLKIRNVKMLNHYLKILFCFAVVVLSVSVFGKEKAETEKSDDDVIELQVSPQMRDRVKQAFERGKVFDEGDVTVVELDEENSAGILSQNDDAIVIAPPEDRSTQNTLGDTLKSAVSPRGNEKDVVSNIARAGAGVMCKAFLAVFPLAVRMGYGLDLMTEGVARSIMGKRQRTPAEREALWQEYAQWELKIQKAGRSIQYMVFEYDEYVEDDRGAPASPAPVLTVKEELPQKVVMIDNVIQTRYVAGRRTVFVGHPARIRPHGHRIRHRVHYLPGVRRHSRRKGPSLRPVVIRKKRHNTVSCTAVRKSGGYKTPAHIGRAVSRRRPRIVMHTKGYRARKAAPFRGGKRR